MLIVQSERFTRSRISTVVVVAITSNTLLAGAPGNVLLPMGRTGLPRDSIANVSQVITLDKRFLTTRVGLIPGALLLKVEPGHRLVLEL